MNTPPDSAAPLMEAARLRAAHRYAEAERLYLEHATGSRREEVLGALADLYMETGRIANAANALADLVRENPAKFAYRAWLSGVLDRAGEIDRAAAVYIDYLRDYPDSPSAYFNLALIYKRQKRYPESLQAYQQAIDLEIADVAEVHSNMGLVYSEMRDAERAEEAFLRAIQLAPRNTVALFNLAGLYEESGRTDDAAHRYREIREIDGEFDEALCRLAQLEKIASADARIVSELESAVRRKQADPVVQEALHFALGKAYDDCEDFDTAVAHFDAANRLGELRVRSYDRTATTRVFDEMIEIFDGNWLDRLELDREEEPVFICGMLRSGSTLAEQLLARHSNATAGGELDFISWEVSRHLAPFPGTARTVTPAKLAEIADAYSRRVRQLFPLAERLTDKRPDNFLYLGLIRAMYPRAKIVHTTRNPIDNCISIYCQQLGAYLGYATNIRHIAHFYEQHRRLMRHWDQLFGDRIFKLDYDSLVASPAAMIRRLCDFLGLEWREEGGQSQQEGVLVKTASVLQVRAPVNRRGLERWKNYPELANQVREELPDL